MRDVISQHLPIASRFDQDVGVMVFMSAWQVRAIALQDYPDWADLVDYSDAQVVARFEWKNGRSRRYVEYSAAFRHRKLADSRTITARTPTGFANKLTRLFDAWDMQWRAVRRLGGVGAVSPQQQGAGRGAMYVQVVYIDDVKDATEVDIAESIRHNALRKPNRGERNLQHAYVYRWPFAQKPHRGDWVIGTGTLAFVTRLSKSGSDYRGYTLDLDAFIGGGAQACTRDQLIEFAEKYPRGSLTDEYYSSRFSDQSVHATTEYRTPPRDRFL